MPATTWFKEWFNSPYYYLLYFQRDQAEAAAFIDKLIDHLKPPPASRMLDVACGKGRLSLQLALKGFEVTGIDLAPDIIREAKQKECENLQFFLHDMRLPFWVNYFDYAFNFFTSFGYFRTRREHDDAMRTIATSLKPGGIFVIDYLNTHYVEDHLVRNELKNVAGTSYRIHRWDDETHFYKKIVVEDDELK